MSKQEQKELGKMKITLALLLVMNITSVEAVKVVNAKDKTFSYSKQYPYETTFYMPDLCTINQIKEVKGKGYLGTEIKMICYKDKVSYEAAIKSINRWKL